MGLTWYLLSAFVHTHALLVIVAVLPFPTSYQWTCIMDNCFINFITSFLGVNLTRIYLTIFCPCFIIHLDSIRNYVKYAEIEYNQLDSIARMERRMTLAQSQRNYFISGAAMILCIVFPRVLLVRIENGRTNTQRESVLKKVIKELVDVVREVGEENDVPMEFRNKNDDRRFSAENLALLESIKNELETLNREREIKLGNRLMESHELSQLRAFYNRVKQQAEQERSNFSNVQNNKTYQRLPRTRFSSSMPMQSRTANARVPPPRPNYHYEFFD